MIFDIHSSCFFSVSLIEMNGVVCWACAFCVCVDFSTVKTNPVALLWDNDLVHTHEQTHTGLNAILLSARCGQLCVSLCFCFAIFSVCFSKITVALATNRGACVFVCLCWWVHLRLFFDPTILPEQVTLMAEALKQRKPLLLVTPVYLELHSAFLLLLQCCPNRSKMNQYVCEIKQAVYLRLYFAVTKKNVVFITL